MTETGIYHGGLVFLTGEDQPLDRFCRIVTATLEDYGHQVERQRIMNRHQAQVVTSRYMIKLSLNESAFRGQPDEIDPAARGGDARVRHRLEISMTPVSKGHEDRDISELMLVVMLYRMVDVCNTEQIEWMDPGTILTVDQFLSAFSTISPHRVHKRHETVDSKGARIAQSEDSARDFDDHDDFGGGDGLRDAEGDMVDLTEEEVLALSFREDGQSGQANRVPPEVKAQNDIRRLTAWGLTGMVAFMSAPVAISMAAVNLARGEDFRLNTQVLSLTGLLVVLQSSGTLASAVSLLPV